MSEDDHKISLEIMEDDIVWNCTCGRGYSHLQMAINHILGQKLGHSKRRKEFEREMKGCLEVIIDTNSDEKQRLEVSKDERKNLLS